MKAQRGRRLPDEVKKLRGTYRGSRSAKNPPKLTVVNQVPVPSYLDSDVKKEFVRIVKLVVSMGIATEEDVDALVLLALRLNDVAVLTDIIKKEGRVITGPTGGKRSHPAVKQRDTAIFHAHRLLTDFGLTPAARSKVSVVSDDESNPFDDIEAMAG